MNTRKILSYTRGRLFQLMIGAISFSVIFLSAASIYLTSHGFDSLHQEVAASLQAGQQEIAQTFEQSLTEVSEAIAENEQQASQALASELTASMQGELQITKEALSEALMETADALADMLAAVSAEAILSKKFSTLISYVKVANGNPRVIYAVYMRPGEGKPFTRYINRNNPAVKALLAEGEGRTPLDKLFSAAVKDPSIKQINRPITFDGKELGSVRLGVSMAEVNQRAVEMQARFDRLSRDSGAKVQAAMRGVAQTISEKLQTSFALVDAQSLGSIQAAQQQIDHNASALTATQAAAMALIGILILTALCSFFMLRVISPINHLRSTLQGIAAGEGDLTQRLPEKGDDELTRVAKSFNLFVDKIQQTLIQTNESANELNAATDTLAGIARDNNDNVSKQRAETQQVATAVTEMAATVREIAQSADSAATAAREANGEAAQGKEAMGNTVHAIDTLAAEVSKASEVINQLEADSESIGSVLEVIRGIAEQTNLLALNAAIEAARAGEQGRGFAVVADEVRTLASRTQESTREIQSIIENLQNGTRNAVQVMKGGLSTAEQTVETASRAGQALNNIVQSVSTIMDMNTQIATASEEHTIVAQEIDQSVVRISGLSETATEGSTRTAAKSQELSDLGDKLQELIRQFKVG